MTKVIIDLDKLRNFLLTEGQIYNELNMESEFRKKDLDSRKNLFIKDGQSFTRYLDKSPELTLDDYEGETYEEMIARVGQTVGK